VLDDSGDIEGVVFVEEVDEGWVDPRWGSCCVGHGTDVDRDRMNGQVIGCETSGGSSIIEVCMCSRCISSQVSQCFRVIKRKWGSEP
jgi:hypothetical protein